MSQHWDLKKGSGFKPTGVQGKALAALSVTDRDFGVPTACRSCLLLCFHKTKKQKPEKKKKESTRSLKNVRHRQ
jgi:hypothetical protein